MRGLVGNLTLGLRSNIANSSLTIGVKKENMNKRIGSVQFDRKVLRNPALHIAKPLGFILEDTLHLNILSFKK